jgi:hypothetical protein
MMMNRVLPGLLTAAALGLATPAQAATPISGAFELQLSGYHPQVDSEPGLTGAPYHTAFGDKSMLLFEVEWQRQFFQKFGSLAGAIAAGYGELYGKGVFASDGSVSSDNTALKVVPLKALLVYRFDVLARRWNVPLVPFGKFGLVYETYQVTNGSGDTSTSGSSSGSGGRWGWEGDVGLALLLDWFDPNLAKDFDIDVGVNHSYFFAAYRNMSASRDNPFAAPSGLRLNDKFWVFGLSIEY